MEQEIEHSRPSVQAAERRTIVGVEFRRAASFARAPSWPASCARACSGGTARASSIGEPRLDPLLADVEREVRAHPPAETEAVRDDVQARRPRPDQDAAVERSAAAPRAQGAAASARERPGRRDQLCSLEFQLPYGLYDRRHIRGADHAAARPRRRGVRRHSQGRRPRRRPHHARRRPRAVRQPDVGLGAHDGDDRDDRRAGRRLRAGRCRRGAGCSSVLDHTSARMADIAGGTRDAVGGVCA